MQIEVFPPGPLRTNAYLVADEETNEAWIIDAPPDRARAKHGRCMAVWIMLAVIAPLVGCSENWAPSIRSTVTACATAFAPASANGALIATERTIDGYHARFELRNDAAAADATPAPPDRVTVPGLRWTLELTIPPNTAPSGKVYLEIHTWSRLPDEKDGQGRAIFDPLSSPTGMSSRWQWSGPVQVAALEHGYQLDAGAYLWPQIAIGSGEFSPANLGSTSTSWAAAFGRTV